MNETWIFWLIPFAGHGLSQIWASIHLHVYFPYLRNVFMGWGWGGLSGRYLSCLEVGLSISGYSLLLLFYVFFFSILNHHLVVSVLLPSASFVSH